jgi:hypothetical protein
VWGGFVSRQEEIYIGTINTKIRLIGNLEQDWLWRGGGVADLKRQSHMLKAEVLRSSIDRAYIEKVWKYVLIIYSCLLYKACICSRKYPKCSISSSPKTYLQSSSNRAQRIVSNVDTDLLSS